MTYEKANDSDVSSTPVETDDDEKHSCFMQICQAHSPTTFE
jgi:hypothetical protein